MSRLWCKIKKWRHFLIKFADPQMSLVMTQLETIIFKISVIFYLQAKLIFSTISGLGVRWKYSSPYPGSQEM